MTNDRFLTQPYHYTIDTFMQWKETRRLILQPYYQRPFCWTLQQQEALIDSIYRGLPLPAFFIREIKVDGKTIIEVVDGQQRLTTILDYINGGLILENYPYSDNFSSRLGLLTYQIIDASDNDIMEIYNRLNFNGTSHKESERAV